MTEAVVAIVAKMVVTAVLAEDEAAANQLVKEVTTVASTKVGAAVIVKKNGDRQICGDGRQAITPQST